MKWNERVIGETREEYYQFCEGLLIEELIKEFDFNCKLTFKGKQQFGGSDLTTYYFQDENGITWERDVPNKLWFTIACKNSKMRPRKTIYSD